MRNEQRLIGGDYDKDRFSVGFRRAAYAMVSESYKVPDTPTGRTLQEMLANAMERSIETLPTAYYQLLEAAMEDGELSAVAEGESLDKWNRMGDARLGKLIMDMTVSVEEAGVRPRDERAAEAYYDACFPERARKQEKAEREDATRRRLDLSHFSLHGKPRESGEKTDMTLPEATRDEAVRALPEEPEEL